jgi:hypothetical protein
VIWAPIVGVWIRNVALAVTLVTASIGAVDAVELVPGNIVITDWFGNQVVAFAEDGTSKGSFTSEHRRRGPKRGDAGGAFVTTDTRGNLYISRFCCPPYDGQTFPRHGLFKFAADGSAPLKIAVPVGSFLTGIAVDRQGAIYAGDHNNNVIRIYSPDGTARGTIGVPFQPFLVKHGIGDDLWVTYQRAGINTLAHLSISDGHHRYD